MVSPRKRAANRANAKRSTGPRTAAGKEKSRRNALKHFLSVPPPQTDDYLVALGCLTRFLAGADPNEHQVASARQAAEAHLALEEARRHRIEKLELAMVDPWTWQEFGPVDRKAAHAQAIPPFRHELRNGELDVLANHDFRLPDPAQLAKLPYALLRARDELKSVARYEQRAFGRRAVALRNLQSTAVRIELGTLLPNKR